MKPLIHKLSIPSIHDGLPTFLHQALDNNHYQLSRDIENQFLIYLHLLDRWNKVFNLTAIQKPEERVLLHIVDSLSIHPFLLGNRFIDVGTGAGLPGIPLAILYPEKKFTLLDSNSKKTRFLTQVVQELKLNNVDVVHVRAESYQPESEPFCFNAILSRAFASLAKMIECTTHLLCPGGQWIAMKGIYPQDEIAALPARFKVTAHKVAIAGLRVERTIICIKKSEP